MIDIEKSFYVTVLNFLEKSYNAQNGVRGTFLGPKYIFLNCSYVDKVFLKFYLMKSIYKNVKVTVLILKENSYYAQYVRNVLFLGSKGFS